VSAGADVTMADIEALATPAGWAAAYPRLDHAGAAAMPLARRGLRHPDKNVRKWSAALMDHHADEGCIADLVAALRDSSPDVRRHALHSLSCQACKPSPLKVDVVLYLVALAMSDSSIRVRRAAAHMLGNQPPDERAAAALREIAGSAADPKLRFNARWALSHQ
jgi:HEAT repeat protein